MWIPPQTCNNKMTLLKVPAKHEYRLLARWQHQVNHIEMAKNLGVHPQIPTCLRSCQGALWTYINHGKRWEVAWANVLQLSWNILRFPCFPVQLSTEVHVPLIHLAELRFSLITFAFLYQTSLPCFRASLVYSKLQQNMNIGCELKSLHICGGILTTYIQVIL